jgi:hypothetical protein
MDAVYMGPENQKASIGDVVMTTGDVRAIVIGVKGSFVKILGIATKMDTGVTFVLNPRLIQELPASECRYLEKQTLTP